MHTLMTMLLKLSRKTLHHLAASMHFHPPFSRKTMLNCFYLFALKGQELPPQEPKDKNK